MAPPSAPPIAWLALVALAHPLQDAPAAPTPVPAAAPAPAIDPAARALFEKLCAFVQPAGAPAGRVSSFTAQVVLLTREGGQTNEDTAALSWLAPDWVRLGLSSGREHGRGPNGYWLRDPKTSVGGKAQVLDLVGRERAEDRRQIDETAAIAQDFAALCRPRDLALERLQPLAAAPAGLPPTLRNEAARLAWIEVATPGLRLPRSQGLSTCRAALALDPSTGRPRLAVIRPEPDAAPVGVGAAGAKRPPRGSEDLLLVLERFETSAGAQVPTGVLIHRALALGNGFEPKPNLELWLVKDGLALQAPLEPTAFNAPTPR